MSGQDIADEVKAALAEVTSELGDGTVLTGTITRYASSTGPEYNPTPTGAPQVYTFNVALSKFSASERQGTDILDTDTKILCSYGDVTPQPQEVMDVGDVAYKIYGVNPLNTADFDIYYTLWARK